jgi:cytochrome P450
MARTVTPRSPQTGSRAAPSSRKMLHLEELRRGFRSLLPPSRPAPSRVTNPNYMLYLRPTLAHVILTAFRIWGFHLVRQSPISPYLRACLNESMRLFPLTAHGLPRVTPEEGWLINGDFIPGGTTIAISAYIAHRDEKIFPEPEKFKPERE